ncbi:MAG TPA: hypothetical protein VI874_00400 [Candidatus Norongarragalinales archaeon]|nr:hypothetical protein [Candidatus Norongarragalinales archaeon]
MSFWRSAFFDDVGLHGMRSWKSALFSLAVSSSVLAFPTGQPLVLEVFLRQAALSAFLLAALILFCFAAAKLLGSQATVEWFFKTVAAVSALGLSIAFVLGWSFIQLGQVLSNEVLIKAAFSVLPFYSFALFGWGVEKAAHLQDYRGFLMAVLAITVFVLLHFFLEGIVVGI